MAELVAATGVEQRMVIAAALDGEFINTAEADAYRSLPIAEELRSIDLHALSTAEYFQKIGLEKARPFAGKRTTTIPSRKLMLPVGYITRVLDAVSNEQISPSKAAEMLMIDEDSFRERFPTISLPAGTQNVAYSATLAATGGSGSYSWSISSGSLPAGLQLTSGTGAIGGTPTTTGTFSFVAQVTDTATNNTATAL
jgi:hypothetical protein